MPILSSCTHCGHKYWLPDQQEGKTLRCAACGAPFTAEVHAGGKAAAGHGGIAVAPFPHPDRRDRHEGRECLLGSDRREPTPRRSGSWLLPTALIGCAALLVLIPGGACITGVFLFAWEARRAEQAALEAERAAAEQLADADRQAARVGPADP